MELEHSFTIPVPPEQAWEALLDVGQIAPCMPGATVDSVTDEVITGRIKVKVGPVTLTYAGTARFTQRDDQEHSVTLEASGRETRGSGTATATVRSMLRGEGDQTEVLVHTTLAVTGRPAQFGRGMLTEVGGRIIDRFAANLAAQLAGGQVAAGAGAASGAGAAPGAAAAGGGGPAAEPAAAEPAAAGPGDAQPGAAGAPHAVPVEELRLPARAAASLRQAGLTTVGDLAARDEQALLALPGVGPQTISQIRSKLTALGVELGAPVAPPPAASDAALTPAAGAAPAPAAPAGPATAAQPAPATRAPAAPAPATPAPAERMSAPAPRPADEEAMDLLAMAGGPVLKRLLPAVAALLAVLVVVLARARRRRRTRRA